MWRWALNFMVLIPSLALGLTPCEKWFESSKLKPGSEDCVLRCSALKVDMKTFDCGLKCEKFCAKPIQSPKGSSSYSSIVDLAGLTKEEIALVVSSPNDAKIVYAQMEIAQALTQKRFGRDFHDDESDAYRHIVWSALLVKELNVDRARKFLNAHESANDQEDPGTVMDKKNNEVGIKIAHQLKKLGKLSIDEIDRSAIKAFEKSEAHFNRKMGGPIK